MFVAYKLQLTKTSKKLTTRWKLKSRSKSKPPRKANWNRNWDRSHKLKLKSKSKLTENWNRNRNWDRLLKSRSKSRSTTENESKMEIDFGAKKTFGSRLRVRFHGPLIGGVNKHLFGPIKDMEKDMYQKSMKGVGDFRYPPYFWLFLLVSENQPGRSTKK